ncbi:MAG: C2H2-type zinc finger protein [Nitrososphaerota archaeon]|nr:C2H2-type zinc finger protein [Candidatus Calditenuaceae archaeon]MDW8073645.1 C2H2-type zinc finger protein [Nitrososphaerota archaeon]
MSSATGRVKCPYCETYFDTKQELSKHINRVHIGKGLLEGERSKW